MVAVTLNCVQLLPLLNKMRIQTVPSTILRKQLLSYKRRTLYLTRIQNPKENGQVYRLMMSLASQQVRQIQIIHLQTSVQSVLPKLLEWVRLVLNSDTTRPTSGGLYLKINAMNSKLITKNRKPNDRKHREMEHHLSMPKASPPRHYLKWSL